MADQGDEYEKQDGECPQGRPSVADERQGNPDDRHYSDGHAYVYEQMHEQAARHAVSVYARETFPTVFGIRDDSPYHECEKQDDGSTSQEAPFFADGAEDEVRALFGYEAVGRLRPFHETLSEEASRANGYHRLVDIVSYAGRVVFQSEQDFDTLPLVVLQYVMEYEIHGEYENQAGNECRYGHPSEPASFPVSPYRIKRYCTDACSGYDIFEFQTAQERVFPCACDFDELFYS